MNLTQKIGLGLMIAGLAGATYNIPIIYNTNKRLQQIRPEVKRIVELEKITKNADTNLYSYTGNLAELKKLRQLPNIANDLKVYNKNEPKQRNATSGILASILLGVMGAAVYSTTDSKK